MSNETNVSSKGPSYFWHFFLSFFKTLYNKKSSKSQPTTSTCVVSWNLLVNMLEQFLAEEWTWSIHIFWFKNLSETQNAELYLRWRPVVWMEYGAFESAVYIVWIPKDYNRNCVCTMRRRRMELQSWIFIPQEDAMYCTKRSTSHMPMAYGLWYGSTCALSHNLFYLTVFFFFLESDVEYNIFHNY